MKQILNKILVSSIFLFLFFVPIFKSSAIVMPVMDENDGSGGGTTVTTTTGTTVYTNQIDLVIGLDQGTPYTGSKPIKVNATASVNVCSNTSFNLKVLGSIYKVYGLSNPVVSPKVIFDQGTVGGNAIAKDYNFTAPTVSGDYTIKFEAIRYDPSGYVLTNNSTNQPIQDLSSKDFIDSLGGIYTITTNYRGRIINAINEGSTIDPSSLPEMLIDQNTGFDYKTDNSINEEVIGTKTIDYPFSVGAPESTVTKTSTQAIPYGTSDVVKWTSLYASNCRSCKIDDPINGANCPGFIPGIQGEFITGQLKKDTTYYIKCDNLP